MNLYLSSFSISLLSQPASFSSLAVDRLEQYQLSCLVQEFACSFNQLLISQTTPDSSINKAFKTAQCMTFYVSFVKTESELVNIARKMLLAGVMINAMNALLTALRMIWCWGATNGGTKRIEFEETDLPQNGPVSARSTFH